MDPGCIVRCRNRDWVLLPGEDAEVHHLRPLTGATDEVVAIDRRLAELASYDLPEERLRSAVFPLPTREDVADAAGAQLLWQAARLTLREGATPFRSLGRISIRPRVYQFVPLLMALRLDPVRLLIADDVGVGKTIEALLVARELLDRGEVRRICVLCPPALCDQWQKELAEKFNLEAVVVRAGTVGQLDRRKTGPDSIYRYYPIQVASIDFLKTERNKHAFLLDCPELVIVDEAHGAAEAESQGQQQRHQLVRELAARPDRHLLLLTATPHSGLESTFRSLLGLLRPEFDHWQLSSLKEAERAELARHFVQRTRRDIEKDWEGEHCFPRRDSRDETYPLSDAYLHLFEKTYRFCSEMVRAGEALETRRRRVRYWGALALLRCVMSSPAAAVAALGARHEKLASEEDDLDFRPFVFESAQGQTEDEPPTPPVEGAEATLADAERRRLRELGKLARELLNSAEDTKLAGAAELVAGLLHAGFHPILWCRYVATAEYLARGLQEALRTTHPGLHVVAVTGRTGDEERRARVEELAREPGRVLVATDCLSEGINLQDGFDAVLHYDLPWNPNRLEQREGRVDRYGQRAKVVKAIRYFSPESAVDGVVLDVLLNKAREIHRTLGTHVPVPEESETVTEALLNALFLRGGRTRGEAEQLQLFEDHDLAAFHSRWDLDADRERVSRTRFAQRALKPDEVRRELEAADAVLGDPAAVRDFVLAAAQRVGLHLAPEKQTDVFRVALGPGARATLPEALAFALPPGDAGHWRISFSSPTPEGAEYLGRNHRFVAALARYLLEEAMTRGPGAAAARCGVIRTRAVARRTVLLLLRVRYLLRQPERPPLLAEEVVVSGFHPGSRADSRDWLTDDDALRLLGTARPEANIPLGEKQQLTGEALAEWPALEGALHRHLEKRAAELEKSHRRVRQAVALKVREVNVAAQLPPDLLGLLVLQPVVE